MEKVKSLHTKFEEDLIYFKDSHVLAQKLKEAIISGCEECETVFFQQLKGLTTQKGALAAASPKEIMENLNKLAIIMDKCKYYRYFDKYAELRQSKLRDLIENKKLKSKYANPAPLKEMYNKGAHHLASLFPQCADLFEEEKNMCENIFKGVKNVKAKFLAIITTPLQQLQTMLDACIDSVNENIEMFDALLIADLLETICKCYPKYTNLLDVFFAKIIKKRKTQRFILG